MTQDDVIRITRSLGICELTSKPKQRIHYSLTIHEMLELFNLVIENERKEFAIHAVDLTRRAAKYEREACADRAWIALVKHKQPWDVRQDVTEAIRARGEA
jgi:hypothetical protein